jgi:hypothetical protein
MANTEQYPPPPSGAYQTGSHPPPPPPPTGETPRPKRRRWPWIVGGVVAVVLIVAAVAAGTADDDRTTASEGTTTTDPDTDASEQRTTTTDEPAVTTTPPPAGPTTVAMGTPVDIEIDEIEFDQDKTYATVTLANPTTAEGALVEYGIEPEYGLWLVVDATVAVSPESAGTYSISSGEFHFVGGDGTVFSSTYAGIDQEFDYHDLSAGQKAVGKIVFDIAPDKLAGGKVQLDDTYEDYGEPLAFWTL